jgi:hypothetical protein
LSHKLRLQRHPLLGDHELLSDPEALVTAMVEFLIKNDESNLDSPQTKRRAAELYRKGIASIAAEVHGFRLEDIKDFEDTISDYCWVYAVSCLAGGVTDLEINTDEDSYKVTDSTDELTDQQLAKVLQQIHDFVAVAGYKHPYENDS